MYRAALVASVFDQSNPLYGTIFEADGIHSSINGKEGWKCFPIHKASIESISAALANPAELCYQIFHFAGHAFDKNLQFNDRISTIEALENMAATANYLVNPGGLAQVIMAANPIQLVFLNGCSTLRQVEFFKKAGAPAVIYTNRPLSDALGVLFAKHFYTNFFKNGLSLEVAFQIAQGIAEGLKINLPEDGLDKKLEADKKRGMEELDEELSQTLFSLEASDDFKKKKLADWPAPVASPKPGTRKNIPIIPEECALLCNRAAETDQFELLLEKMAGAQSDQPLFFFVHDLEEACPNSLSQRFQQFVINDFCKKNKLPAERFEWLQMELPELRHRQDDGACLARLKEIFERSVSLQPGAGARADRIILVHHHLNRLQIEWDKHLERLFKIYIRDFSQVLGGLSSRVGIICSMEYYEQDSPFRTFFKKLKTDYDAQVFNLTEMSGVHKGHVGNWLNLIFENRLDKPPVVDFFPFAGETPMLTVQQILQQEIRKFNQKLRAHG